MQAIWHFFSSGETETDYLDFPCEYLGSFDELINEISEELFTHDWDEYTTFTKKDYDADPELYKGESINYHELPDSETYFDSKEGLKKTQRLKKHFMLTKDEMIQEDWINEDAFKLIMNDLHSLEEFFEKLIEENRMWYLNIDLI